VEFVEQVKNELGVRAQHREVSLVDRLYTLRRRTISTGKMKL